MKGYRTTGLIGAMATSPAISAVAARSIAATVASSAITTAMASSPPPLPAPLLCSVTPPCRRGGNRAVPSVKYAALSAMGGP